MINSEPPRSSPPGERRKGGAPRTPCGSGLNEASLLPTLQDAAGSLGPCPPAEGVCQHLYQASKVNRGLPGKQSRVHHPIQTGKDSCLGWGMKERKDRGMVKTWLFGASSAVKTPLLAIDKRRSRWAVRDQGRCHFWVTEHLDALPVSSLASVMSEQTPEPSLHPINCLPQSDLCPKPTSHLQPDGRVWNEGHRPHRTLQAHG